MHAVHICTVLCQRHFSPHTHNFQHCFLYGYLSKAPQAGGLNESRKYSVWIYYTNTASWMCKSSYRNAFLSGKFFPYFGLQLMALQHPVLSSMCNWEEWIPERIHSGGRLGHLSPRHLQPNTLALTGELVEKKDKHGTKALFRSNVWVLWLISGELKVWKSRTSLVWHQSQRCDHRLRRGVKLERAVTFHAD